MFCFNGESKIDKERVKKLLNLAKKNICNKDDYLFDFLNCLEKRINETNPNLTISRFKLLADEASEDLRNEKKVPEVYDEATVGWIKNFISKFTKCIFSQNEELISSFFKKEGALVS